MMKPNIFLLISAIAFANCAISATPADAQESIVCGDDAYIPDGEIVCEPSDPWQKLHAWIFRRYAGSVEMESKTPYPPTYSGRYTYGPWKPDWVKTSANLARQSHYTAPTHSVHHISDSVGLSSALSVMIENETQSQPPTAPSHGPHPVLNTVQVENLSPR